MSAKKYLNKYRIESTRLPKWDYSWNGYYYVTICTQNRVCYMGNVADEKMVFSKIGEIANRFWLEIPDHFDNVLLDTFQVMPNHVHGIVIIDCNDFGNMDKKNDFINRQRRDATCRVSTAETTNKFGPLKPKSLQSIIHAYKSSVKRWCNKNNQYFHWQSRYYDHIIRSEKSLNRIRQYIINNPKNWERDRNKGFYTPGTEARFNLYAHRGAGY